MSRSWLSATVTRLRVVRCAERLAEDLAQIHHLPALLAGDLHAPQRVGIVGHVDLDHGVVEQPVAELLAEHLARGLAGIGPGDGGDHALFGGVLRAGLHVLAHPLAGLGDGAVGEVADDLLDIAADIADLGEFRRLDLDEGRAGELRQTPADLGLADAGGADHQDVLGIDLLLQVGVELLAPPAVAQGDGGGALGVGLADDEAVELGDDLAGGQVGHRGMVSTVRDPLV